MQIKVEKLSKVVFRGEASCQCKLEINMNKVVDDSKVLTEQCWLCCERLQVSADVTRQDDNNECPFE